MERLDGPARLQCVVQQDEGYHNWPLLATQRPPAVLHVVRPTPTKRSTGCNATFDTAPADMTGHWMERWGGATGVPRPKAARGFSRRQPPLLCSRPTVYRPAAGVADANSTGSRSVTATGPRTSVNLKW
eukprot:39979-Chlamydomonas_euryale.AAC.1